MIVVIHWPVAFPPGKGLFPPHPTKEGEVELDLNTTLVETWKAMIALPKSKVRKLGLAAAHGVLKSPRLGPSHWCFQFYD